MVTKSICGNHFTQHVNQTMMLYTLSLYNDAYQLFLNKTRGKGKRKKKNQWGGPA